MIEGRWNRKVRACKNSGGKERLSQSQAELGRSPEKGREHTHPPETWRKKEKAGWGGHMCSETSGESQGSPYKQLETHPQS